MYLQIFIYMFYFIPHLMQLFMIDDNDLDENHNFILVCNIISSFVLFLFFLQELIQIRYFGVLLYFQDVYNIIDLLFFPT